MKDKILMAHGAGGKLAHELIAENLLKPLNNTLLANMDDSAVFDLKGRLAFTTDSYVINPLFFPGGDIGRLAVCGTVNDLATSGARPLFLSLAFIIEEGLPLSELEEIVESIRLTAQEAGVMIITGDTKVVNHGCADKLFINTAGIGRIQDGVYISGSNARPGDKIILSGTIGDHGIAVMCKREGMNFSTTLESDCAPLGEMVAEMLNVSQKIRCLRDPTRGGLATTLNELAGQSKVSISIEEDKIPVKDEVLGACEMLGLDPLYVANEGKIVAIVPPDDSGKLLEAMRKNKYGMNAAIIGEVTSGRSGRVTMKTILGASRIIGMLTGDPLPRIC